MTLLKDLITIPEAVHKGDFVMSLASGVADSAGTLENYVVTPQLADAYDNALRFIASAINENKSKAAYLDGSFGSGKSHFMAVLHLLLQRDPAARAIPELGEAIAASDGTLLEVLVRACPVPHDRRRVDGAGDLRWVRQTPPRGRPEGDASGVYADDRCSSRRSSSAAAWRRGFLRGAERGARVGWWRVGGPRGVVGCNELRASPHRGRWRSEPRTSWRSDRQPVHAWVRKGAERQPEGYVDLDTGLAELARHARDQGHQGLILFLDELILWLGSRIRDTAFVEREGQKLIKLIEFTTSRPIPIVSFVARQRDLREFVGDEMPGADKLSFADALKHWNDRFHRISLADRNLPKIAERRLLKPKGEAERLQIDAAFAQTEKTNPQILDILMTEEGDRELFRSTYPFSPAFMATLVAASSALQRERTALRVMLQLLVDRRDELTVGDLVSVGDLFDVSRWWRRAVQRRHEAPLRSRARRLPRPLPAPAPRGSQALRQRDREARSQAPVPGGRSARQDAAAGRARAPGRTAEESRRREADGAQPRLDRVPDPGRREGDRAQQAARLVLAGRGVEGWRGSAEPVGRAAADGC